MKYEFIARVTKAFGINRQFYKILLRLCGKSKDVEQSNLDWEHYLLSVCPDEGRTCLCEKNSMIVQGTKRFNVEIVIPVYNTELYVEECIESVLNQKTHYSFRVVIVNDGSTDNSPEIINRYASDKRVRIIHQENRGLSGSRNRALDSLEGDYVTFLDSDDRLPEDAIEKLLNKAYEDDYDIVGGGYARFGGRRRMRVLPSQGRLYGFAWGKVYKSRLWENVHFPEKYWFEDTICAMIIHDIAIKKTSIPEVIYWYRVNRKGICSSSKGKTKVIDSLWVTKRLLKDREMLGLTFDGRFLDQLVTQCKVNTFRIYSLGDELANIANFEASKEWYFRYCQGYRCHAPSNKPIEEAILRNDYRQFLLACLFL